MYACSINSHRDSTEQIAVIILFMNEETKGQIKKNCIASYIAEDKTEFGKKLAIPFVVLLWFYPQKKKTFSAKTRCCVLGSISWKENFIQGPWNKIGVHIQSYSPGLCYLQHTKLLLCRSWNLVCICNYRHINSLVTKLVCILYHRQMELGHSFSFW